VASGGFHSREEEELYCELEELARLQSELAEAELNLATLRSELLAFERRYLESVGGRCAELDALEAAGGRSRRGRAARARGNHHAIGWAD